VTYTVNTNQSELRKEEEFTVQNLEEHIKALRGIKGLSTHLGGLWTHLQVVERQHFVPYSISPEIFALFFTQEKCQYPAKKPASCFFGMNR
jgi:hypothetical protein